MPRRTIIIIILTALAAVAGLLYWALSGPGDPRQLILGDWKEHSSHLYVEVTPQKATARGMMRGSVKYEWLQTDKEPFRLRFTYRHESYEALISFPDKDSAVVEPQIWDKLPVSAQRMLRDVNRRHNRPENEFRLLFHRRAEAPPPSR